MPKKSTTPITILLLVSLSLACSMLRPKRPLTWHLTLEIDAPAANREAAMKPTIAVIERRLDALGVSNFEVKPQGDPQSGRILVSLPDSPDRERLKLVIASGKLELTHVITPPSPAPVQTYASKEEAIASLNTGGAVPPNRRVLPFTERADPQGAGNSKWVVVESPAIVDGSELRDASAVPSTGDESSYNIHFSLRKTGADKFGAWTGANINEYLGVVLDDQVKSIAFIKSQIFDSAEITGRFTKQSAEDLALVLRSGALPAPIRIIEEVSDKK